MVRIGFPMGWFAAAGNDNAGPAGRLAAFCFHGRRQMHQRGDRTENALRMIDQADQLPQGRLAAEVDYPIQLRVVMPALSYLDKLNSPSKMINNLLVTLRLPPFNCQIIFPSRRDDPKRDGRARDFVDLGVPGLLLLGEMNVTFKRRRLDVQPQALIEEFDKAVEAVVRDFITLINQGVSAFNFRGFRVTIGQDRDMGIVLPEVRAVGPNIGEKLAGIAMVQIAHGGSEHDNVPHRKTALQNQLLHGNPQGG